jgi:hypothetical protein
MEETVRECCFQKETWERCNTRLLPMHQHVGSVDGKYKEGNGRPSSSGVSFELE